MKRYPTVLPTLALLSVLAACGGQDAPVDDTDTDATPAPAAQPTASAGEPACVSPQSSLVFNIGPTRALLCYGAPSAQGREVMGGLVPYGVPWLLGADAPTTLHLGGRSNVGGIALEPGSYSLYAIPGEDAWQFFINSNWQRGGVEIDAAVRSTEVANFTVAPQPLPDMVETLTYTWEAAAGGDPGGELVLQWGRTVLLIPMES